MIFTALLSNRLFSFSLILFFLKFFYCNAQVAELKYEKGVVRITEFPNGYQLKESDLKSIERTHSIVNFNNDKGIRELVNSDKQFPLMHWKSKDKEYERLFYKYKEIFLNKKIYGFIFYFLVKKRSDTVYIKYNRNLYSHVSSDFVIRKETSDVDKFTIDYKLDTLSIKIDFDNPFFEEEIIEKNEEKSFRVSRLNNDARTIIEPKENKLLLLELSLEGGLGGSGNESYSLENFSSGIRSEFKYQHQFRTGHFSISPVLTIFNIGINATLGYEIRQPRNGIVKTFFNEELIGQDNGISNIFPKSRYFIQYGFSYRVDFFETFIIIPFLNVGSYSFTAFASDDFNQLKKDRKTLIGGVKFVLPTNSKNGAFYINFSLQRDYFSGSKTIRVKNGNEYVHSITAVDAQQYNIAFGYLLKIL